MHKKIFGDSSNDSDDDEASAVPQLDLRPENMVMERRNEGNSYPEAYIDQNAWLLFLDAKFTEWRKTRVLYQETM